MITESEASTSKKAARENTSSTASSNSSEGNKQTISPAERWLLIRENVYVRAQKRGFVGGNSFEDWLEAEQEIDAQYATDFRGVFTLTDAAEITEQFKRIFAGYDVGHLSVDALLDEHRDGMEQLAAFNRDLINNTSELANQQTALFQEAVSEAAKTLQSAAQGRISADGAAKQAELSTKVMENALSYFEALTESMTGIPQVVRKKGNGSP